MLNPGIIILSVSHWTSTGIGIETVTQINYELILLKPQSMQGLMENLNY